MAEGNAVSGSTVLWAAEIWPRLYKYFYYRVQNREEAEELTQETFERVHPKIVSGEVEKDKIEAYCFVAAKNLIAEVWRKRVRQPAVISMDEMTAQGWEPAVPEQATGVEDFFVLERALQELSDEYRRVLILRIIEGRPVSEVAGKMKRSPGAVRSLQFRAVRALKELLDRGGYFHE